ncbi:hypothetical protein INT46_007438 [Mucor plumbeus]|uniref:C2H2-type domain-containing protein n=1 Tax=Mucor plumbeus TaxID=97098 RepID=A0A8H7RSD3_9FUNG|nr:hypothetical protein INT46_007438 [Mucor plumbeus]
MKYPKIRIVIERVKLPPGFALNETTKSDLLMAKVGPDMEDTTALSSFQDANQNGMETGRPKRKRFNKNYYQEMDIDVDIKKEAHVGKSKLLYASLPATPKTKNKNKNNKKTAAFKVDNKESKPKNINFGTDTEQAKNVRFSLPKDDTDDEQPMNNQSIDYYCDICEEDTEDYRNNLKHHLLFHEMKAKQKQIIHFWLEPDSKDPNHNCRACERTYNSTGEYRRHLKNVHRMPLREFLGGRPKNSFKKLPSEVVPGEGLPEFGPELDEINLYCRKCNRRFQTMTPYRYHLTHHHNINLVRHPNLLPDWNDANNYCRSCDFTYTSLPAYQRHCKRVHKMGRKGVIKPKEAPLPDPYDPNFYCRVCNTTNISRKDFRRHCRYTHNMDLPPPNQGPNANPDLIPELNNKDNYCRTCDKKFDSKRRFWVHLRLFHKLNLKAMRKAIKPDVYDPNNYCRSCDKTFLKKYLLYNHIRKVHSMATPKRVSKKQLKEKKMHNSDSEEEVRDWK